MGPWIDAGPMRLGAWGTPNRGGLGHALGIPPPYPFASPKLAPGGSRGAIQGLLSALGWGQGFGWRGSSRHQPKWAAGSLPRSEGWVVGSAVFNPTGRDPQWDRPVGPMAPWLSLSPPTHLLGL